MTMFFAKKLNKKGFTLAELLIVVAVIAVLVAIAVPIFNGALKRARIGVHTANARTLKAMGAVAIMADKDFADKATASDVYTVTGTYNFDDETFAITTITVDSSGSVAEATVGGTAVSASGEIGTDSSKTYVVTLAASDVAGAVTWS